MYSLHGRRSVIDACDVPAYRRHLDGGLPHVETDTDRRAALITATNGLAFVRRRGMAEARWPGVSQGTSVHGQASCHEQRVAPAGLDLPVASGPAFSVAQLTDRSRRAPHGFGKLAAVLPLAGSTGRCSTRLAPQPPSRGGTPASSARINDAISSRSQGLTTARRRRWPLRWPAGAPRSPGADRR
jgi:hypothetical protein